MEVLKKNCYFSLITSPLVTVYNLVIIWETLKLSDFSGGR